MQKSSLLIINKNFPPVQSASGRLAYDLANYMADKKWQVTVLTAGEVQVSNNNINVVAVKRPKNTDSRIGRFLIHLRFIKASYKLKEHQVVITMTDPPFLIYLKKFFIKRKTTRHIHWMQDFHPDMDEVIDDKSYQKQKTKMLRYLKGVHKIVVIGRCMQKRVRQKNILPDKIELIPNWTNLHGEHLQQTGLIHAPQGADAASHNLITDNSPRFRIIYPGNLGKPHPVGVIIRAAELLREHKEIEFLFVGDEHANSRLSQEREKRELENIKFIPFQPAGHFQTILESADLHLVTLRPKLDGYLVPCKFYASLAVGRPVIFLGPKESEIGQVIKEYGCGEIIEEMKAEKLADAILKYRHEGDVWFSAQEGSQKAAEVYQPMKSLSQWTSLLEQKASL